MRPHALLTSQSGAETPGPKDFTSKGQWQKDAAGAPVLSGKEARAETRRAAPAGGVCAWSPDPRAGRSASCPTCSRSSAPRQPPTCLRMKLVEVVLPSDLFNLLLRVVVPRATWTRTRGQREAGEDRSVEPGDHPRLESASRPAPRVSQSPHPSLRGP